jgi:hypothetical protein
MQLVGLPQSCLFLSTVSLGFTSFFSFNLERSACPVAPGLTARTGRHRGQRPGFPLKDRIRFILLIRCHIFTVGVSGAAR